MSLSKAEACARTICCLSEASSNRQFDERYFLAKFYPESGRDEFWLPTYPLNCSLNNCRVSKQRTHKYHLRKKIKRKKLLQSDSSIGYVSLLQARIQNVEVICMKI